MPLTIKPWQHAALSLLILVVITSLGYSALMLPAVQASRANEARITDLKMQLDSYHAARQSIAALEAEITALGAAGVDHAIFYTASTPALAAAELQRFLRQVIESRAGHLMMSQPVIPSDTGTFPRISVKINMRGDIQVLHGILYEIATASPDLTIDNLTIQRQHAAARRVTAQPDILDTRFDVTAYFYRQAGPGE